MERFAVGLHMVNHAQHFDLAFISVNRLRERKSHFVVGDWIMDSGAFTEIAAHGDYRHPVSEYAAQIRRWKDCGNLLAAVSQDYMCEAHMLKGRSIADNQRLTIGRYDALLAEDTGVYIMPVLQGYAPADYVAHLAAYGSRLAPGAWVGVGSVCKRNGDPKAIERVLLAIKTARPDLRLHGFGLKGTALGSGLVCELLHTADSMAWSFAARKARHHGDKSRSGNDWREARRWVDAMLSVPQQTDWSFL